MEAGILIYNIVAAPLTLLSVPLRLLFKKDVSATAKPGYWAARLGVYPEAFRRKLQGMKRPLIWIHAVSVGEAGAAGLLIRELKKDIPQSSLLLSVTTKHGLTIASARLSDEATIFPFPLDLPNVISAILQIVKPDLYISIETEIWPNLITSLNRKNIPVILLNGRISSKSFPGYAKTRWLWKPVFEKFNHLAMISQKHRERALFLGAPPERTDVRGNIKLALISGKKDSQLQEKWETILDLSNDAPLIVFGSLRLDENIWALEIFDKLRKQYPELVGIFAPRHLKRIDSLEAWLNKNRTQYQKLSSILKTGNRRIANVVLVDTMGKLAELYSVATVAFCGGSLVPVGGHNILEPVAWGKPVFYGPYMGNFSDIQEAVEELGLGFQVKSKTELYEALAEFLSRPSRMMHTDNLKPAAFDFEAPLKKQVQLVKKVLISKQALE